MSQFYKSRLKNSPIAHTIRKVQLTWCSVLVRVWNRLQKLKTINKPCCYFALKNVLV